MFGLTAGCDNSHPAAAKQTAAPVKVEVDKPVEQEVTDYRDFTGRLQAVDSVEIRARVSGYLTKVDYDASIELGAEVKKGDLLFEIDERPFKNSLETAEAKQAQAEAELKVSSADLVRTEELFKKKVRTQEDLDHDIGKKLLSEAEIQGTKAAVAQAKLDLEFSKITAPFDGRIGEALFSVGDLISPATGKMTTLVSVDPMYVYFDMDEPTLLTVQSMFREGKLKSASEAQIPVMMGLTNDAGYPFSGRIDFVENQVNPDTGTLRVRGVFANPKPEKGPRPLSPGLFARIRLPLGEPHKAVLIAERAIGRDQGSAFVYVVGPDNNIIYRPIKLGAQHGSLRVILEGLTASEQIVVNGLQRVRSGVTVDPQPPKKAETEK
jgi:RND family efflux transporter MFP subunit